MIRLYRNNDLETVTRFWYDAQRVAMPRLMSRNIFEFEGAREYFRNVITVENQIWVYELDSIPVAFLGIKGEFIDRLYVNPAYHRQGIGTALIEYAKTLSPGHLWLYTHQANKMARSFYEKNGFMAEKFGVSPAPESEPDMEYHWRRS